MSEVRPSGNAWSPSWLPRPELQVRLRDLERTEPAAGPHTSYVPHFQGVQTGPPENRLRCAGARTEASRSSPRSPRSRGCPGTAGPSPALLAVSQPLAARGSSGSAPGGRKEPLTPEGTVGEGPQLSSAQPALGPSDAGASHVPSLWEQARRVDIPHNNASDSQRGPPVRACHYHGEIE